MDRSGNYRIVFLNKVHSDPQRARVIGVYKDYLDDGTGRLKQVSLFVHTTNDPDINHSVDLNMLENLETMKTLEGATRYYDRRLVDPDNHPDDDHMGFHMFPNPYVLESWWITGARGSGKTLTTVRLLKMLTKMQPERDVVLITANTEAEEYEPFDPIIVRFTENDTAEQVATKLDIDNYKGCIVVFDDFDDAVGKSKQRYHQLLNTIINRGRHFDIICYCTYHLATKGSNTRTAVNGADRCVVFPGANAGAQLCYFLENYCGISKKLPRGVPKGSVSELQRVLNSGSRWVMIGNHAPRYIMSNIGVYLRKFRV